MRSFCKFILLSVILLTFSTLAKADPFQIAIGRTLVFPENSKSSSDYYLQGEGLSGDGTTLLGSFDIPLCINNCNVVGSTFNLSGQFSSGDSSLAPLGYLGRITYLGNSYVVTTSSFSFLTGITNPLPPLSSFNNGDYTTAFTNFTMTATLTLRSLSTTIPNAVLNLTGSGIASIDYVYNPTRSGLDIGFVRYRYNNAEGEFIFGSNPSPTPEPTPEPATLLLLGTGLAGILGYARRRKKASETN